MPETGQQQNDPSGNFNRKEKHKMFFVLQECDCQTESHSRSHTATSFGFYYYL